MAIVHTVTLNAMYLVMDPQGSFWDGIAWGVKGREFLSYASATRSLHEEGEDLEVVYIMPKEETL